MEAWPSMATEYGASDFELDRHGREVESTGKLLRWAAIESWKCGHRGYLRGFGGVRAPVREKGRDFGEFVQSKLAIGVFAEVAHELDFVGGGGEQWDCFIFI
ncbi:hypothetical protein ACFX13_047345 [Malus domestica]